MTVALAYSLTSRFLWFLMEQAHENRRMTSTYTETAKCRAETSSHPKGRHAVLVLDYSRSMQDYDWWPTRQIAAQQAALAYCQQLNQIESDARVAMVAYGSYADRLCGLTSIKKMAKFQSALEEQFNMEATNITSGLEIAEYMLRKKQEHDRPNQVILLTDGEHNIGHSPMAIAKDIRQIATLECIGIAGTPSSVDEPLLKAIASTYPDGRPRYRWIGDKGELIEHFKKLAGGLTLK